MYKLTRRVLFACASALGFCAIQSCTPLRLEFDHTVAASAWATAGGNLLQQHYRASGAKPPLVLNRVIRFSSAPGRSLLAADSVLFIPTQGGRIYLFDLPRAKFSGKIKLPENSDADMALGMQGKLVIGLKYGRETLMCYDLLKGEFSWKRRAGLLAKAPVVADSSVYVVARFKHADRYDLASGERVWRYEFESQAHTTPAISDELVLFGTDSGKILALSRQTGKLRWESTAGASIFASPVISGNSVFFSSTDSTVYALNLHSGELQWTYRTNGRIRYTPATANNLLVVSNSGGELLGLNALTGEPIWSFKNSTGFSTSPLIVDDVVYIGDLQKQFFAFGLQSGRILWQQELRGRVRTDPIAYETGVFVGSEDRFIYIFQPRPVESSE